MPGILGFQVNAALLALLAVAFGTSAALGESSERSAAPSYTAGSLVNPANGRPGPFAPNQMVALYGSELAWSSDTASPEDIRNNLLPVRLQPGVQVLMVFGRLGVPMPLQMVSPGQINFVLPASADPGPVDIAVVRDGMHGPLVRIELQDVAPALAENPANMALAAHPDGRLITPDDPAVPGQEIVLHATGLGPTVLRLRDGEIPIVPPRTAAGLAIRRLKELSVLLDGEAVDRGLIAYAGLTPGVAAMYQIRLRLPFRVYPDPEIRIAIGDRISPEGVRLPVQPAVSAPPPDLPPDPLTPAP
jgi:uncharacterized protein (TIGR03437 family)